ncbi:hypothetical protein Tco_0500935 [Tanacetum coccineum]
MRCDRSAFLYGKIVKKVYVSQPPGFKIPSLLRKLTKWLKFVLTTSTPRRLEIPQKEVVNFLAEDSVHAMQKSKPLLILLHRIAGNMLLLQVACGACLMDSNQITSKEYFQVSDQAKEIKLVKAKITKLKKKANPVIKHFKAYQKRISKEQRQQRKRFSKKKKVQIESVLRQRSKVLIERVESTTKQRVSTEEQSKEEIASQASQTSSLTPTLSAQVERFIKEDEWEKGAGFLNLIVIKEDTKEEVKLKMKKSFVGLGMDLTENILFLEPATGDCMYAGTKPQFDESKEGEIQSECGNKKQWTARYFSVLNNYIGFERSSLGRFEVFVQTSLMNKIEVIGAHSMNGREEVILKKDNTSANANFMIRV